MVEIGCIEFVIIIYQVKDTDVYLTPHNVKGADLSTKQLAFTLRTQQRKFKEHRRIKRMLRTRNFVREVFSINS